MSKEEHDQLIYLNPAHFKRRIWAALAWAREWALTRGNVADPALLAEFNGLYNERERRDILAVVTCMDFANRIMNTLTNQYLDLDAAACELPPLEKPKSEKIST